ncbi:uncharacterized protein PV07_12631 [Cladophialophora immunda]|uniref:O-methyltransferase C-terminal domain-containing protein n=1 Tax=Cladophialophora immunda TaxID=569365 RepID=A0A0D2BU80_9EURO|nr:uncharacterized protein PV07_12631 [Cladophialophora immunda]KIW21965.1 hypothetical protein PV07_12631 [Cladophialophora immunda]
MSANNICGQSHGSGSLDTGSSNILEDRGQTSVDRTTSPMGHREEILTLLERPRDVLMEMAQVGRVRLGVLQVMVSFNVASTVPIGGSRALGDISALLGIELPILERIFRFAFCSSIFQETAPGSGVVMHTELSKAMVEHADWLRLVLSREIMHPSFRLVDVLSMDKSTQPRPTAAELTFGRSFWDELGSPTSSLSLQAFHAGLVSMLSPDHTVTMFPGHELGNMLVVDVGGGWGQFAIDAARMYGNLSFLVQDLAEQRDLAEEKIPSELRNRVRFSVHDFFQPQPVVTEGPVCYFLRRVLHDWNDIDCVRILQNLRPGLQRPGSKLFIAEFVLPDVLAGPRVTPAEESVARAMDLTMLSLFFSKERTITDFQSMLHDVDPRLNVQWTRKDPDSPMILLEAAMSQG